MNNQQPIELDEELERSTNRWMRTGIVFLFMLALAFPLFRVYEPAQRAEAREAHLSFLADHGSDLFEVNCSSCHGARGIGGIAPAVAALEFLQSADDEAIFQLISVGVVGTDMVAYSSDQGGPMTHSQIEAITTYLRSLEEDATSNAMWRTPLADEALTGRDLYTMACSRCHGLDLGGIEDVGPSLDGRSDAAEDSDSRLGKRIREGEEEMPRFGTVLTDAQIDLIVAYLREAQAGG